MEVTVKKLEKSQVELKTTVSGDTWTEAQAKAFKKIAKDVNIPGFRKGSAPKKMLERYISTNNVLVEAVDLVAGKAFEDALAQELLAPIDQAQLNVEELTTEQCTLTFTFTVAPEVELGEYKGVEYKVETVRILQKDVDAEVEKLQGEYTELVAKEGAVETGDTAVIDFEGFKDGVAFDGGKGENFNLEIGSGAFIPGFEEQLVGMNAGETREISVTFPEQYQAAELAGQPATFKVVCHEVKAKKLPELNDEFAADVASDKKEYASVESYEQLREVIKKNLSESRKAAAAEKADNDLLETVIEAAKVEIPEVLIVDEAQSMVNEYAYNVQNTYGIKFEEFLKMVNQTVDQLLEQVKPNAERTVKSRLVLSKIAAEEKIEVTAEEIEAKFAEIAAQYNMELDKVKEAVAASQVSLDIRLQKAVQFIKDSSVKSK